MTTLPALVPEVSADLSKAVAGESVPVYGGDYGVEFRDRWRCPSVVPLSLRDEANTVLEKARVALTPPTSQDVTKWLVALGLLVASKMTEADARAKVAAFVPLIDHPAGCFTSDSLKRAAKRFDWWPSFKELSAFLDAEAKPCRDVVARLEILASARPMLVAPGREASGPKASPERIDEIMGRFRQMVAKNATG